MYTSIKKINSPEIKYYKDDEEITDELSSLALDLAKSSDDIDETFSSLEKSGLLYE